MPSADRAVSTLAAIGRVARREPRAIAIVDGEDHISYGELWARAGAWARRIGELGGGAAAGESPLVGVLGERSAELTTRQLAAWMAGAGYLPLDPRVPPARLATILSDARCEVVLTTHALRALLPPGVVACVEPSRCGPAQVAALDAGSLAYVIYTSGSTGSPKGVEIEHGSLASLMAWYRAAFRLGPGMRTSMCANVAFDGLVLDAWGSLSAGATVCVARQEALADGERIVRYLDDLAISHAYLPTPLAERVLGAQQRPARLRSIITGGDRLRSWPAADYPAAVHNCYGPTETTVLVTATGDLRTRGVGERLPSIGRAVCRTTIGILAPDGTWTREPPAEGELVVGGPLVGRGYRCAPELTAEAFRQGPPFGPGRWYRTGDVCSWHTDGELSFRHRRDRQVKIEGYRIELGEIEQAVLRCAGVRQAVATTIGEDPVTGVVAWVEGDVDCDAALRQLAAELPRWMVPAQVVSLDCLPTTTSGKLDRARLARLDARDRRRLQGS